MDQISAHFLSDPLVILSSVQKVPSQLVVSRERDPIRSVEINKPMAFIPLSRCKQELTTPTGSRGLTVFIIIILLPPSGR